MQIKKKVVENMHPSKKYITFLYMLDFEDISERLRKMFGIHVSKETMEYIEEEYSEVKKLKNNKVIFKKYLKKLGLYKIGEEEIQLTLEKFSKDKKKLYFLNTALYRDMNYSMIADLLNTNFTELEKNIFFTEEEVQIYKDLIFNVEICSNEDLHQLFSEDRKIFDYENKKSLEEIQTDAGLVSFVDPSDVVNTIQSLTFLLFKKNINSRNKDTQMDALKFGEQARKSAMDLIKINSTKETHGEFENIVLSFRENPNIKIYKREEIEKDEKEDFSEVGW